MKIFNAASAAVLGCLVAVAIGSAEAWPQSVPAPSSSLVGIGADSVTRSPNSISLAGRVEITQDQNRLRADRVELTLVGEAVSQIEARGSVYFVTPAESIRGDAASYRVSSDTIVITGDVILLQGNNVLTGSSLTYNTRTGAAEMTAAPGSRVRGVFTPNS